MQKRFDEGFKDGVGTNKEAMEWARTNTFTDELNPNSLAGLLQKFSINFPAMKQIIPFVRTPVNIASSVIQRLPIVNLASKRFRQKRVNRPFNKDLSNIRP